MRVVHVIRSLLKSGAERLCIDICNELRNHSSVDYILIVLDEINEFPELTKDLNIVYCNSKVRPSILGKSIIDTEEYGNIINDFKPDLIHSHLFWSEILTRQLIFPNVTYVTHCHDSMVELHNFSIKTLFSKQKLTRFYEKRWLVPKYIDCKNNFLVISNATGSFFQKVLPKRARKISMLHNAIDVSKFSRKKPLNNFKDRKIKLINIGRFTTYKNQIFLVKVIKLIVDHGYDTELLFLGDGDEKGKVQDLVKKLELTQQVCFKGFVDDVQHYLWDSDVYVHSAYHEPLGLVLLEAMAAGLPVVTLDGKGNRDIMENGINGFLLENENEEEFSRKIIDLFEDKELYKRMSKNAVSYAKKYDIVEYTDELIKLYKSFIKDN